MRELHFLPPAQFTSDLDFVVEVQDAAAFKQVISHYDARPNKFGGYGLKFHGGIRIDFWSAQETWANVEGHKNVSRLEDVVETTFFNVDAILYVLGENRLVAKEGTREALNERFLDVNLLPNPNPAGAAIRAIRKLVVHHMRASGSLLNFIAEQIDTNGWQHLSNLDAKAYPHRPLLRHVCNRSSWSGESFVRYARANGDQLLTSKQLEFEFRRETPPHFSARPLDERS
ncbi:hypothetical protein FQ775_04970 [Nitratireductor mangrovi]|uniref:Uncharacterized protein n=1 Tax=Nitratireductor mangrovi TaxID=2599600 RepID=A0A5B8KW09_9HYPH|nr:hypothetical protein [Nitratireductor mangrovi]QDY99777.1 hypothetical protein FQ775_04970 [Nitratireductor mangrovi]